jgi:hypothetical protein
VRRTEFIQIHGIIADPASSNKPGKYLENTPARRGVRLAELLANDGRGGAN